MSGIFELRSPADLLAKLGRELEHLRAEPNDSDHAFNFFVTAEHMLDWKYPGMANRVQREAERKTPLLQLVSHIASGAKHFDKLLDHHQSVATTGLAVRHPSPMMRRFLPDQLTVVVTHGAAEVLGTSRISVLALAEHVYAHWRARA